MAVDVGELKDALLDHGVARAEGMRDADLHGEDAEGWPVCMLGGSVEREVFAPSIGPEQTQPIIAHEQIEISSIVDPVFEEQSIAQVGRPAEIAAQARSGSDWWLGDDDLAAAMRWYVDSKFGQEVPDGESL